MAAVKESDVRDLMVETLEPCEGTIDELEANCCVPGRSPQMKRLRATLEDIGGKSAEYRADLAHATELRELIEDAGSQIGRLQVSCCAPSRTPLYDDLLHRLTRVQRLVTSSAKLEH